MAPVFYPFPLSCLCPLFVTVALVCFAASAQAQSNFQRLRSFGNAGRLGVIPSHGLLLGADGALYGTAVSQVGSDSGPGVLFNMNTNGTGYSVLHLFPSGQYPSVPIEGRDGALYGATAGGTNNGGTIFKINPDGSGYAVLYSFSLQGGYAPNQLVQGVDGMLYGVTSVGGNYNAGTIFKLSTDGTGYADLYHFGSTTGDGNSPNPLMQARDGVLYGTCSSGWTTNAGTVYKINTNGSGYALLYSFQGAKPQAALIQGSDGELYGTTSSPFSDNPGSVFRLNTDGSGFSVLHSFGKDTDGTQPKAPLWQAPDGTLYGTTITGGPSGGYGTVFKMDTDGGNYSILHSFGLSEYNNGDPNWPYGIIPGSNGDLYCVSDGGGTSGLGTIFTIRTNGTGYAVIYNFGEPDGEPANPSGELIQGRDGALYATSYSGGNAGVGGVFTLQTNGTGLAMLYSFSAGPGAVPDGLPGLVQAADGMLYGVFTWGGSNNDGGLFKVNTDGTGFATLHTFSTTTNDGQLPYAALMQAADGALYGTTYYGGIYGGGTVFKINPDGTGFTTLHDFNFSGPPLVVGERPACQLLQANDGLLYGTTSQGGTYEAGSVFRLSTNGNGYAVLYSFRGAGGDGYAPIAGLIQGNDGALYGTTLGGGTIGYGTVFKLNPDGSGYAILHSFSTNSSDGQLLYGRLVQANNGVLYGTTQQGGSYGQGTIFGVNTTGTAYRVVYHFGTTPGDGQTIVAGLLQGTDGALYGQAWWGGDLNRGTVFRLIPPPLTVMPPVFTSITRLADGNVSLTLNVTANATYSLQSSSDLVSWAVQTNVFAASPTIQATDLTATNASSRFYRAVWMP